MDPSPNEEKVNPKVAEKCEDQVTYDTENYIEPRNGI